MHDGSVATLEEVIDHYAAGGRTIADGSHARRRPRQPEQEPDACAASPSPPSSAPTLLAFLRSLTDEALLHDPRFASPWKAASVLPGELAMALSARNHLPGVIDEIVMGDVLAHITVRVGEHVIESVITRRSAEEMGLKKGDTVTAVVKATEVMLAKG